MKQRLGALLLILVLVVGLFVGCGGRGDQTVIVVGAKDYTEQFILGHMTALLLEYHTDFEIEFVYEMSTSIVWAALNSGDVDLYIEYTGTVYTFLLGYEDTLGAQETFDIVQRALDAQYDILMLEPLGFNNTYTLSVMPDFAAQYNLRTFSDLAAISQNYIFGGTFEVINRPDGLPGLQAAYGMQFQEILPLDGVLRYLAIENGDIQITDAFSTDGMLLAFDLVVLEDDLSFFPPYFAAPIIRRDTAEQHPILVDILAMLANILDDDTMRALNYRVDVLHERPEAVARDFLLSRGLIS